MGSLFNLVGRLAFGSIGALGWVLFVIVALLVAVTIFNPDDKEE